MNSPILSICIPTYNRCQEVVKRIRELSSQFTDRVEIIISINGGDYAALEDAVAKLIPPFVRVVISVNRNNIGGAANCLRCIEKAEGAWVWLLGDDDPIAPDAIVRIVACEREEPSICAAFFAWRKYGMIRDKSTISTLQELAGTGLSLGDFMFTSCMICRRETIVGCLRELYTRLSTQICVFPAVLKSLERKEGRLIIFNLSIVANNQPQPSEQYSSIPIALGLPMVLDYFWLSDSRRAIQQLLARTVAEWLTPERLAIAAASLYPSVSDWRGCREIMRNLRDGILTRSGSISARLRGSVLLAFMYCGPRLFQGAIGFAERIRGTAFGFRLASQNMDRV